MALLILIRYCQNSADTDTILVLYALLVSYLYTMATTAGITHVCTF